MGRGAASRCREEIEIIVRKSLLVLALAALVAAPALAWEHWGGDRGGTRFSQLAMITPGNVDNLVKAWEFHTFDLTTRAPEVMARTKFESTPLFVEDSIILCSPFNTVFALDPDNGLPKWQLSPFIDTAPRAANRYNCRGVPYWVDQQPPDSAACRSRIFMGTNDARLFAIDAKTGALCAGFGDGGEIRIDLGEPPAAPGEFQI